MNIVRKSASRVRLAVMVAMVLLFGILGRASATVSADPDLTGAVTNMAAVLKVNGLAVAVIIFSVAIIIWLVFWAFGKLKKTAGR